MKHCWQNQLMKVVFKPRGHNECFIIYEYERVVRKVLLTGTRHGVTLSHKATTKGYHCYSRHELNNLKISKQILLLMH